MGYDVEKRGFNPDDYQVAARMGGIIRKSKQEDTCPHCDDTGEIPIPEHGFVACPFCAEKKGNQK